MYNILVITHTTASFLMSFTPYPLQCRACPECHCLAKTLRSILQFAAHLTAENGQPLYVQLVFKILSARAVAGCKLLGDEHVLRPCHQRLVLRQSWHFHTWSQAHPKHSGGWQSTDWAASCCCEPLQLLTQLSFSFRHRSSNPL